MKYEIKDLEKGRTIKSVQIVKGKKNTHINLGEIVPVSVDLIMVDYLDGTQDVFEFNEETLKRIQNKVDYQVKLFVNQEKVKFPLWFESNVTLAVSALLVGLAATFYDKILVAGIISAAASLVFTGNAIRLNSKNKNIKKHKIYVDKIMGKLEEYNDILKKENALSKEVNKNLVDIINIDNKSVKELEYIGNKIERYNDIEGKSPKKKSL